MRINNQHFSCVSLSNVCSCMVQYGKLHSSLACSTVRAHYNSVCFACPYVCPSPHIKSFLTIRERYRTANIVGWFVISKIIFPHMELANLSNELSAKNVTRKNKENQQHKFLRTANFPVLIFWKNVQCNTFIKNSLNTLN